MVLFPMVCGDLYIIFFTKKKYIACSNIKSDTVIKKIKTRVKTFSTLKVSTCKHYAVLQYLTHLIFAVMQNFSID